VFILNRNQCSFWTGIGVQIGPEYAVPPPPYAALRCPTPYGYWQVNYFESQKWEYSASFCIKLRSKWSQRSVIIVWPQLFC